MAGYPRGTKYLKDLQQPAREGLQALENAGLVLQSGGQALGWFSATRLGQSALADGTVAEHLNGS